MLSEFHAAGYRSLRQIRFPIGRVGVFVGANGVGKTNLRHALARARGRRRHGALWAGERDPRKSMRMTLGAGFAAIPASEPEYAYDVSAGVISCEVRLGVRYLTAAAFPYP